MVIDILSWKSIKIISLGGEMKKLKIGVLGLGQRGEGLLKQVILEMEEFEVVAVSDIYQDRVENAIKYCFEKGHSPEGYLDSIELLDNANIDCVLVATPWISHVHLAIEAMKRKIPVAMEVGGSYEIHELWKLVDTYEETKTPFMFMENCCYGRIEMMTMNMVNQGILGEIVHASGGYMHDLRDEVSEGFYRRHYRINDYEKRNLENYPTHEIGPIAKILKINEGNRFLTLSSQASKAAGLSEYIKSRPNDGKIGDASKLKFKQGDVVSTTITCANGELVTIKLDTLLPRYYSRGFQIQGTKGMVNEENMSVFLESDTSETDHFTWHNKFNNMSEYFEKYDHPVWKKFLADGVKGGHGGMDYLTFKAFADALIEGREMPINVYDAATWMVISTLSEQSIALGGHPVAFPDFTLGKWMFERK